MSVYRFEPQSLVKEITLRKSVAGGVSLYLFARDDITQQQIGRIKDTFDKEGVQYVPSELGGKPCLNVHGINTIERLESILRKGEFISGMHQQSDDDNVKYSIRERFANRMLFVTGALCVMADIGILLYGYLKQKLKPEIKPWEDMAASFAYTSGSMVLTLFGGGDKSNHHIQDFCTKLQQKMKTDGLLAKPGSALNSFTIDHQQGSLKKVSRFLNKHPSETYNALTATAGGFMALSARKSNKSSTRIADSILGISTLAAGSTAALVKEKPQDPAQPKPTSLWGKTKAWVQSRPNRVAGYGYMIASFAHGYETLGNLFSAKKEYGNSLVNKPGDWTHGMKQKNLAYTTYAMRACFFVPNLLAEVILTLSSKANGGSNKNDKSVENTAYAIVADTIMLQAPEEREKLIHEYSRNFLARADILGGKPQEIEASLQARVEHLAKNPWGSVPRHLTPSPTKPDAVTNWQEKVMTSAPLQAASALG